MDRATAQALTALVPTLSPLPPELLQLAVSLLAQSRNKASSLKGEEEIARTYACAHIACERLKQPLALPKIQPSPPCPPRVYQKLYKYLDSALPASSRRINGQQRLSHASKTHTTSLAQAGISAKSTPVKSFALRNKAETSVSATIDDVPAWVMPAIRHLCKGTGAPGAPHHIFAGVSSILTTPAPNLKAGDGSLSGKLDASQLVALIAAVFMMVRTRLSGKQTTARDYPQIRDEALEILRGGPGVEAGDDTSIPARIGDWIREIGEAGWLELDWFQNIGQGVGLGFEGNPDRDARTSPEAADADEERGVILGQAIHGDYLESKGNLQPGLGTMMQDRVDYLSDKRRSEYQNWKKGILRRLDELERAQPMKT